MFGELTVFVRPSAPAAAADEGPTFPLYLLPSLHLPFRRRRTSTQPGTAPVPVPVQDGESPVPSLSSTPDSPSSINNSPGSPESLRSFFPALPTLGDYHDKSSKKHSTTAARAAGPRLTRAQPSTLRCNTCASDVAFLSQIVSKGFTGRHGRAYLVAPPCAQTTHLSPASPLNTSNNKYNGSLGSTEADLVNVRVGSPENRQLVTGAHVVADIWCVVCSSKLGWKYVDAREQTQKYKVGKFILETARVSACHGWENVEYEPIVLEEEVQTHGTHRESKQMTRLSGDSSSGRGSEDSTSDGVREDHDDDGVVLFDSDDEDECEDIFAGVWDADVVARRRRGRVSNIRVRTSGAA